MFSALQNRDYRLYWIGSAVSMTGGWVQSICHGWLVYQLTDSRFLLGLVGFVGAAPLFGLTPLGGAIADRYNKRNILLLTQSCFALTALSLGVLVSLNVVNIYHIIGIASINGLLMAIDAPTRQSIPVHLVGKKDLGNAIALNSAAFNTARILGPALAGVLVMKLSMALCFFVNSASYVAVILALLAVRADTDPETTDGSATVLMDVREGFHYIWSEPRIRTLILMAAVPSLFVMPYQMYMLIIARDVLKVGLDGYGQLISTTGLGALVGALILAKFARLERRAPMLLSSALVNAVVLILAANSKNLLLTHFSMAGVGYCCVVYNATSNTLLQTISTDAMRGRVMSGFVFVMMGLSPFASLQAGTTAELLGAPAAMTIGAGIFGATSLYVLLTQKRVREL